MIDKILFFENSANADGGHVSVTIETSDSHVETVLLAEAIIGAIKKVRAVDITNKKGVPLINICYQEVIHYEGTKMDSLVEVK